MSFGPVSCDTFVVLPPLTLNNTVIFGKNSDRPQHEVQEVVHFARASYEPGSKVKCTYVEIDQVPQTYSIVLSKPRWMWGAEMGSNEHSVVIGNEAIFSKETEKLGKEQLTKEGLLGMDLVRLGLERAACAKEAKQVICDLIAKHGQSGLCVEKNEPNTLSENLAYHNSFLIADSTEAWVVETIGKYWVAKHITEGFYNISNCLTLEEDFNENNGIIQYSNDQGWTNEGKFNFYLTFRGAKDDRKRLEAGKKLLDSLTKEKKFDIFSMMKILRDKESGICRDKNDNFPTQASQISVLNKKISSHWFTATPDTEHSVFKPLVFTENLYLGTHTSQPVSTDNHKHLLYCKHEKVYESLLKGCEIGNTLTQLEKECVLELQSSLEQEDLSKEAIEEFGQLFEDAVEAELRFYK